jgi:hypothetical protein
MLDKFDALTLHPFKHRLQKLGKDTSPSILGEHNVIADLAHLLDLVNRHFRSYVSCHISHDLVVFNRD